MERRKFLKSAGVGLAAGATVMPTLSRAQASALPEVKWRLASSFPKSLDTIYGAAEWMSKRVAACTGGKFQIQVFAGGEIVPPFGVVDAVQNNTVQAAHTAPYYFWGKDPAFAFGTDAALGIEQALGMIFAFQILRHFAAEETSRHRVGGIAAQFGAAAVFHRDNQRTAVRAIQRTHGVANFGHLRSVYRDP